jgi:alkaline phosphatase D
MQRIHIPGMTWNRRQFLRAGGAAVAAWPFLRPLESAFALEQSKARDYPFALGVASGDPSPDGFVLWTRLAPHPLEGGGMPQENVQVRWQVAEDEQMSKVVAKGTAVATPELAHSVHVEVEGLQPNRWYFYQFAGANELSPVARVRTAPRFDVLPDKLRFAFASCQHYESGYYTAYEHMAKEDLDLIAHLGDYIYEGAPQKGRAREHAGPWLQQLEDYRTRHAQYKTDEHLQAAHAMCPWIVTWDDHEFANNCAADISERDDEPPEQYLRRRANAYQAYYEHMPLRKAQLPKGPDLQLYRRIPYGRLAEFAVLDTRQYRTDQPCGDGNKAPTQEVYNPKATLLGDEQERWLYRTLNASKGTWNVLAQQVMMGRVDRRPGEVVGMSMDQWPGYEANRQRVLKFFAEHPQLNPVVLTGDIHTNWVNDLQVDSADEKSPVVATEFVGTSISSSGDGSETRDDTAGVLAENPFVKFYNAERGYVSCEVTPDRWTSHYRTVPYISRPGAPLNTRRTFVVEAGKPGAEEA